MELLERLADADDEIAEAFLMEEVPDIETLKAGIRRAVITCKVWDQPVFVTTKTKAVILGAIYIRVSHLLASSLYLYSWDLHLKTKECSRC
jgi:hypothetical protein